MVLLVACGTGVEFRGGGEEGERVGGVGDDRGVLGRRVDGGSVERAGRDGGTKVQRRRGGGYGRGGVGERVEVRHVLIGIRCAPTRRRGAAEIAAAVVRVGVLLLLLSGTGRKSAPRPKIPQQAPPLAPRTRDKKKTTTRTYLRFWNQTWAALPVIPTRSAILLRSP